MPDSSFTGIERKRKTRPSVKVFDRLARVCITVGGIGTIIAVTLIMVFLVWVVLPLFRGSDSDDAAIIADFAPESATAPLRFSVDEYRALGWLYFPDGTIRARSLSTGTVLHRARPFADRIPSSWSFAPDSDDVVFGFADGTIRVGKIGFETTFFDGEELAEREDVPEGLLQLEEGSALDYREGVLQRIPKGQFRFITLRIELDAPVTLRPGQAVVRVDFTPRERSSILVALTADGIVSIKEVRKKRNLLTGKTRITLTGSEFPLERVEHRGLPSYLLVSGVGSTVYAVWADGQLARYNIRDRGEVVEAELVNLLPDRSERVTAAAWLIGKTTLLVGSSAGRVSAWFPTTTDHAGTVDGVQLVRAHEFTVAGSAITSLRSSSRRRMIVTGTEDGTVQVRHVTTGNLVAKTVTAQGQPVTTATTSPKEDGLYAATAGGIFGGGLRAEHPDISLGVLFGRVWYEGYPEPAHAWQSTGGTDDDEAKLGLMPLIFGTIKATIYSMLFGLPLALLAAIFASEFLHPRVKSKIKPTIEIMASLPSVVLGFLAGLVIAPFVENVIPVVLTSFLTVPFSFLAGAYLWQLLPHETALRVTRFRFPVICIFLPIGVLLALLIGPVVEHTLFAGDIKGWLDGQIGTGHGGWVFLLIPVSAVLTGILFSRGLGGWFRARSQHWTRSQAARWDLFRFGVGTAATIGLAFAMAWMLGALGLDPRGSVMGTYVQRNALVVGFVMGFAIIPIIFTIAEDALSAVPEHLRSASLGCGATPWQTATRVIVPTAMSGLFSATMIGLGRAVGETMIVLMAAGNTPVMEWNIFNGFRTLSANLAVELPEAVKDSTHFRTLFFAALVLFAMTFILNTVAEFVRQRFRKRAFEL